jgi:hypothetical protein
LKTAEDDEVSLEGNEAILLGIESGGANSEETVVRVGEFIRDAIVKTGGIGDGDEGAGGMRGQSPFQEVYRQEGGGL